MRALMLVVILLASPVMAADHDVAVQGFDFIPASLTVEVGDSVTWTHDATSTFHTITNGTGAADPQAGVLFDVTFASSGQTFTHTFTAEGDVPYFCRPHIGFGMTGLVQVTANVADEPASWSGIKQLWR